VLFAATLSALAWNILFIPPRFTLAISDPQDFVLCAAYFVAALVTGILTSRSRELEDLANQREERTLFLYEVLKDILEFSRPEDFLPRISLRVEEHLGGKCEILIEDTLPTNTTQRFDIKGRNSKFGYLLFNPDQETPHGHELLLNAVAQQLGLSLERLQLEAGLREAEKLKESERLYQTLLNSVSHELRTPLTTLMGYASSLRESTTDSPEFRKALSEGLSEASERMNRVVGNLLDMSRLSSGALSLRKEWHDIDDLIGVVLNGLKQSLQRHQVKVSSSGTLPLVEIDFQLMEHALSNLIVNATTYSRENSQILIEVGVKSNMLSLAINDDGPGIPESALPRVFEKFYRAPGTPPGGTGLGLSIVKSIVELHSGFVVGTNRQHAGARFEILLPLGNPPPCPKEDFNE
jgi:two-component system sensor histidine kinase KdpD